MHADKPDQFVDELLDPSLRRYGGEEPRAGLETRVLAGVRSRQGAVGRRRLVLALACCMGMLAAIVFVFHSAHAPSRRPVNTASAHPQATKPSASPGSADSRFWSSQLVQGPKEKQRTTKVAVRTASPARPARPEQFPTPMPLTEQEKLLLTYLTNTTKPDLLAETDKAAEVAEISGIQVAPLEIEPLDDSQSGQGK